MAAIPPMTSPPARMIRRPRRASGCPGAQRANRAPRAASRNNPNPATSRPMSSLTNSSANAAASAVRIRPAASRSRKTAVSTGTNATSWNPAATASATGQLTA